MQMLAAGEAHAPRRRFVFTGARSNRARFPSTYTSGQVLEAFRPLITFLSDRGAAHREALYQQILNAIAARRVADRPDRFEPRMAKGGGAGGTTTRRDPGRRLNSACSNELVNSPCHSWGGPKRARLH